MFRYLLILSVIIFSFSFLKAESKENFQDKKSSDELLSSYPKMPYDVLSYDLELDLSKSLHNAEINKDTSMNVYFSGKQVITLKIDTATNIIFLDAIDMPFDSTKVSSAKNGNIFTIVGHLNGKALFTSLTGFSVDDTITITIDYTVNRSERIGAYLYAQGVYPRNNRQFTVEEPIFYTQSEYSWARYWMPCNDKPYDKALSSIAIKVPKGYIGVSNGNLDSVSSASGEDYDTETFHWSLDTPISTYLMAANASKFGIFEQEYARFSDENDIVPIKNYCWQIDIDAPEDHAYDAKHRLKYQPDMLRYLSSLFGEYPFDSYGTVTVSPYIYGGMEHNTITTINRDWLLKDRDYSTGLAHEIAHHWLGDLITCATWDDVWINEGGAAWCEALWLEKYLNSSDYYTQSMVSKSINYFKAENGQPIPIWGINESEIMQKGYLPYDKAAFVYHMLSLIIGQDKFFNVLSEILAENRFAVLTTEEYKELIKSKVSETLLNMDIDLFFDEWIYDSGYIKYNIDAEQVNSSPDKYIYDVIVKQVQSGDGYRYVYTMPIDIVVIGKDDSEIYRETVMNDKREQTYTIELPSQFKSISVDSSKVLCVNLSTPTSVEEQNFENQISIIPNPVNDILTISNYYDYDKLNNRIKILNIKGEIIMDLLLNSNEQSIDVSSLIAGTYFVKIGNITKKFVKL